MFPPGSWPLRCAVSEALRGRAEAMSSACVLEGEMRDTAPWTVDICGKQLKGRSLECLSWTVDIPAVESSSNENPWNISHVKIPLTLGPSW